MEEKKNQVVSSDNEEPIKAKKDKSIWKKVGGAALSIGALAFILLKGKKQTKGI